ncbi:hypothetical protein IW139_006539, partial [Coemansia sp. RSA 353]
MLNLPSDSPAGSMNTDSNFAGVLAEGTNLSGYRNHILGTVSVWSIGVCTLLWICLLGVLTADYYGKLPGWRYGKDFSLAFESDYLLLATFLILWGISFIICVSLFILKPYLRNYFRLLTLPADGQYVCAVRPLNEIKVMEDNANKLQRSINTFSERLRTRLGRDKEYTTCPIEKTSEGRIYFTYQCTRYVLDEQTQQYAPYEFDIGTSHRRLIQQADGLSGAEVAYRLELVGPNFIEVKVPSIPAAFVREFVSFFYLYQLMILWIYYVYAYWQVGLVDTGVILLSASIKVALRVQSERRLKQMAEQEETTPVK